MALSNTMPNIKMYQDSTGEYVPVRIQWNNSTRAWHVHNNIGTLHLTRGVIIPTPTGYGLLIKVWEYDATHPEGINFNKVPDMYASSHPDLTSALSAFAAFDPANK
jgi:hypothetical protein